MDINALFPSNFLKASDLQQQARLVTIQGITPEKVGDETKPVLHLAGEQKGLVLNKTNSMLIAANFGTETNAWIGRQIELYPTQTQFQGKIVDAIRVRMPIAPAQPVQAAPVQPTPAAPAQPAPVQPAPVQPAIVPDGATATQMDFDDELPDFRI